MHTMGKFHNKPLVWKGKGIYAYIYGLWQRVTYTEMCNELQNSKLLIRYIESLDELTDIQKVKYSKHEEMKQ